MKTNLDNLPVELRKVVIRKIRWCIQEVQGGIEGVSIKCPYGESHFMLYRWSKFLGIEMVSCYKCGYRYVLLKQDGQLVLVNQPEVKHKQIVVRRK
jgi:Zn ribbon nucleic-acid-binding protein